MTLDLSLVLVLHLACLLVQVVVLRFGLQRQRLYTFFFLAIAFYQTVSLFSLGSLVQEYGLSALFRAEAIAFIGTCMVSAFLLVGDRFVPTRRLGQLGAGPLQAVVERPGEYLVIVGACLLLACALMLRGGVAVAERTWQLSRLDSSYLDSFTTLLLFMVFPGVWIAARSKHVLLSAFILVASLVGFAVVGSRAALLTLPMIAVLDTFLRSRVVRIRPRTLVIVAVAALGLHVLGRMVRGFGLAGLVALARGQSLTGSEIADVFAHLDLSGGEAAIFRYFLFVVSEGPFPDVQPLTSVVRWLGMYIPGTLFPGAKPVDLTYTIWWHAYSGGVFDTYESFGELVKYIGLGGGGSLHPLVWGEMWANGAWPAAPVFIGSLAVILVGIEAVYARVPAVAFVLAAPATLIGYVMVARGNSVIGLGYTAFVLPLALVAYGFASTCRRLLFGGHRPPEAVGGRPGGGDRRAD